MPVYLVATFMPISVQEDGECYHPASTGIAAIYAHPMSKDAAPETIKTRFAADFQHFPCWKSAHLIQITNRQEDQIAKDNFGKMNPEPEM